MSTQSIMGLLDTLVDETSDEVTIGDVVACFEERGFGPLMLVPALLVLLPTGAIPGVPSLCGITLFLICIQIAAGRDHPWLPSGLKHRSLSHDKLVTATDKARPYVDQVESWFHTRLPQLAKKPFKNLVALISGVAALGMIPLEIMPLAAALPAFAICVTAIGITNRDGAFIIAGLVLQSGTAYLVYKAIGMMQG